MHLDWGKDEPDDVDIEDLASVIVPSLTAITRLSAGFGQAWFNGKRSLKDTRTRSDARTYPFWVQTYFYDMRQACHISEKWCATMKWLDETPLVEAETTMKDTTYRLLETLRGWNGSIHGLGNTFRQEVLADVLANEPLPSDVVDGLLNILSLRLQCSNPASRFLITTTDFPNYIASEVWKNESLAGPNEYLKKYSTWIQHGLRDQLLFVFHVPPFHWAACIIDFKTAKIRYGDSLQLPQHRHFFKSLSVWLKMNFSSITFTITDDLPCSRQRDSYNCPIISVNTVAHTVFGDPLWTEKMSCLKRMEAFCDILNFTTGKTYKGALVSQNWL